MKVQDTNYYLLAVVYAVIFFGLTFVNIESTQFMGVDEGSISEAIYGLFKRPYYNMMAWYHSRAYGWTYIVITAIALAPFKLIFHVANFEITNYVIRLVLFLIGLLVVLVLYRLTLLITAKRSAAIVAAIVFMLSPASAWHLYTIHPDSTGILFFLVGSIFFLRFLESKTLNNYLYCLVCLVLGSLAKQPFFIMSLPLLLYMLLDYCNWRVTELFRFLTTSNFWKIFIGSVAISLAIAFVINPAAFFKLKTFVALQTGMSQYFREHAAFSDTLKAWMSVALTQPIIVAHTALFITVPTLLFFRVNIPRLFVFSVVISTAIMLLFMAMQRVFILPTYISPLYPLFLINLSCALIFLYKQLGDSRLRLLGVSAFVCVVGWAFALEAAETINVVVRNTLLHKQDMKYASWNFVNSLPEGSKFVFDPSVAVPDERMKDGCHIWRGCGVMENLEKFQPDYFILYKEYKYGKWEVISKYIEAHNFCIIRELSPSMENDFNPQGGFNQLVKTLEHKKNNDILGNKLTIWGKCQ